MFEAITRFITGINADTSELHIADADLHLAAAALLYHVVAADGVVSAAESDALRAALREQYALDDRGAGDLADKAREADLEAVDFYNFTRTLKGRLDEAGRRRVIELMWRMVFADGRIDEFEDNVVWRVAELLDVPARERVLLKKEAETRNGTTGG